MKTERAIELLKRISDSQFDGEYGDERREALEMAVRALEQNLVQESGGLVKDLVKDCISRKMAIDALTRKSTQLHGLHWGDHPEAPHIEFGVLSSIEIIRELPSAQPQWIPCSERLPEENDDYWVTADPRYVPPNYKSTDIVSWYEGKWLMADYFVLDGEKRKMPTYKVVEVNIPIIAWMPLPKPYGGESDED